MKKEIKIGLIGHYAKGQSLYDGQTVSTRLWQRQLERKGAKVCLVDTYNYKKIFE